MDKADITGVILAGGRARRMGGEDKGLLAFHGRPMIERIIAALRPQVAAVLINANRNLDRYRRYGHAVVSDGVKDYPGPLAGMLSGMAAADTDYILTLPCDSPYVAPDLARRLAAKLQAERARLCVAHDGARLQPVFALLHTGLLDSLQSYLAAGERKIDRWYERHQPAVAGFSDRPETFININTRDELISLQTAGQPPRQKETNG